MPRETAAFLLWDEGSVVFDVVTSETHSRSNTLTEHPVEVGTNITDHVRPNLDEVTLEGFISQTPLGNDTQTTSIPLDIPSPPLAFGLNSLVNLVGSFLSGKKEYAANVKVFPDGADFVSDVIQTLEGLRSEGTLFKVVTSSKTFDNMILSDFSVNRDAGSGTGANFTVNCREIRLVTSSIVNAPAASIPRAKKTQAKGQQAPEETKQRAKSAAKALASNLAGG